MNKLSFRPIVLIIGLIYIAAILSGCATTAQVFGPKQPTSMTFKDRTIIAHLRILSEPPGAKIYIEGEGNTGYAGVTPLEVTLVGKAIVSVPGTIQYEYTKDTFWSGNLSNPTIHAKSWTNTKIIDEVTGSWNISAFKVGYVPATKRFALKDSAVFHKTIQDAPLKLPSDINDPENYNPLMIDRLEFSESIFIPMVPDSGVGSTIQQQQQQTVIIPGAGTSETTARGMLMVSSTPENADIYVDGAFVGNSPANLKLSEGIHIVEVKKLGFSPYKKELRIIESSELNLRIVLKKE